MMKLKKLSIRKMNLSKKKKLESLHKKIDHYNYPSRKKKQRNNI